MNVTVYYITGRQLGPLTVPHSWCEECDITVRLVRRLVEDIAPGGELRFEAKPWIRHMLEALRFGGWHPPVVVISGDMFSQGVVPDEEQLRCSLVAHLAPGSAVSHA